MKLKCWLLAILLSACQAEHSKTLPYSFLWQTPDFYPEAQNSILPDTIFNAGWKFTKGLATESLLPDYFPEPESPVDLPHQVLLPNTALWYQQKLSIPEAGVLIINSDDGAQVWVNGKVAERIQGDAFKVTAFNNVSVLIRVLNNAMAGGLRQVAYLTLQNFENLQRQKQDWLVEKRKQERNFLLLDSGAPFLVGPWLTRSDSTYTVKVLADNVPVKLHWGLDAGELENSEQKSGKLLAFQIGSPKGNWFYKICSGNYCTPVYEITAAQPEFSFTLWGDSQSGWYNFQKHIRNMQLGADAFTIGVGDLVGRGYDEEEWRTFSGLLSDYAANKPAYLVAGNHDYDGYYSNLKPSLYHQYASPSDKPYFAWTYANCAFVAIDPNAQFPIGFSTEQTTWFHNQLTSKEWINASWRFVLLHQPPYSQGWAGYQGDSVVRSLLEPVIEAAKIDFVIAGHTHDYERLMKTYGKQSTHFIISGGGGGTLEPEESSITPDMDTVIKSHHYIRFRVTQNELNWFVYDLQNNLIDKQRVLK